MGLSLRANHATAVEVKKAIGEDQFNSHIKFSVVRNPYDRLLSFWSAYRRGKEPFGKFVRTVYRNGPANLIRPQVDWLFDRHKYLIDYCLRYEVINVDWPIFAKALNLNPILGWKNKGKVLYDSWDKYYTQETADMVFDMYLDDFNSFGYLKAEINNDAHTEMQKQR